MISEDQLKEHMTQAVSDRVFSRILNADNILDVNINEIVREETRIVVEQVRVAIKLLGECNDD